MADPDSVLAGKYGKAVLEKQAAVAPAFDFLASPAARSIFERRGFTVLQ